MRRVLMCDGLIPQRINDQGELEEVRPSDLRAMKTYVEENRTLAAPFDMVVGGRAAEMSKGEAQEKLGTWGESGATWWMEGLWGLNHDQALERIRSGPPVIN